MRHLILMRHAQADDQHAGADSTRPLTEKGRIEHSKVCKALEDKEVQVDAILFSPFLRAKQSAEILKNIYPNAKLIEEPALGEVFDSYTILNDLSKKKVHGAVLVGHEPTLALLAAHLMKEMKPFKLEKSGVLAIEFKQEPNFGKGDFKFYLSPQDLA